jgi:hypothetical protein
MVLHDRLATVKFITELWQRRKKIEKIADGFQKRFVAVDHHFPHLFKNFVYLTISARKVTFFGIWWVLLIEHLAHE